METTNYYTPSIEEFHVGFGYEVENNGKFEKQILTEDMITTNIGCDDNTNQPFYLKRYDMERFRVKHLNREDIESLGWIKSNEEFNPFSKKNVFILNKVTETGICKMYRLRLFEENRINISLFEKISETSDWLEHITLFNLAEVKNRSELKKLMQMLNIK